MQKRFFILGTFLWLGKREIAETAYRLFFVWGKKNFKVLLSMPKCEDDRTHKDGGELIDRYFIFFEIFIIGRRCFIPTQRRNFLFIAFYGNDFGDIDSVNVVEVGKAQLSVLRKGVRGREEVCGKRGGVEL